MKLKIIGTVSSPIKEPVDEDWGKITSEIRINPEYAQGLTGLDGFSHALIVFYMHRADYDPETHLIRHPHERTDLPKLGIFAQRAKHRPNPIGITAVEVIGVENEVLRVKGLDAIDGTPVLDIKPYFTAFDSRENASFPDWVREIMKDYFWFFRGS